MGECRSKKRCENDISGNYSGSGSICDHSSTWTDHDSVFAEIKIGNTEREELQSHQKKNGTPTMGGIMILIAVVITSLFYVKGYPKIIPILFVTVGFGIIGFLDDYLKVVLRRSDGLLAWQKMLCEIVVTAVFAFS